MSAFSLPSVAQAATDDRRQAADAQPADTEPCDLRALFERHYASIWRLLRRLGVNPAQLDDAAQEVFWVAACKLDQIQPGKHHAFLYGVALRVAASEVRRRANAPLCAGPEALEQLAAREPSPEEQIERRRARELLDSVLDVLPIELRSVLVLFELEGLDVRTISEIEGIPIGTVGSRLRRARAEFRAAAQRIRAASRMLRRGS